MSCSIVRLSLIPRALTKMPSRAFPGGSGSYTGDLGAGSGKGGGAGGSVREAGGAFGKMEAAREEEYFRKLQAAQLKSLKGDLDREIEHHRKQMDQHKAAIDRHERRISELAQEEEAIKN